jgi:uncharacterized membrane protein (DUF485 family)
MEKSLKAVVDSPEFKRVVSKRLKVMAFLMVWVLVVYYGFVLLIAFNRPFMTQKIGEATTLGIPLSILAIVLLWAATGVHVWWSNRVYDKEIALLKSKIK